MKKILFITIITALLQFLSCKTDINDVNVMNIDVDLEKSVDILDITEYFQPEIIKLEKTDDCLVGEVSKVWVHSDDILVLDKNVTKSLFLFNRAGKFIRKIGTGGNGLGEYLYIEDFDVINDKIYILSGMDQKLIVFDFGGKMIEERKLSDYGGYALNVFSDKQFFTLKVGSLLSICFWKKDGSVKKLIADNDYSFVNWKTNKAISRVGNTSYICPMFKDIIYKVINNNIEAAYSFNYGTRKYPMEDIHNEQELNTAYTSKKYATITSFSISNDFIITTIFSSKIYKGLYSIRNNKMILAKQLICDNIPLLAPVGDIENGIIYSRDAYFVKEMVDNELLPEKLQGIKPDDNPVIFILKQKETAFN